MISWEMLRNQWSYNEEVQVREWLTRLAGEGMNVLGC